MFYIKNQKCKISAKCRYRKDYLSREEKIKHLLIMYAYLTEQGVVGFRARKFKKWFKNNKLEIMNYYNGLDNKFYSTFISNDEIKKKLEKIFNHDEKITHKLIKKSNLNDDEYNEFLKINKEFNNLLDFLKKMQMNNFNDFFIYINSLLLPR